MADPGVGFKFPPKKVSWLKRDVLLFNCSIGCKADELHFVYEMDENFSTFPSFPLGLAFKLDNQEVTNFYSARDALEIPGVPKLNPKYLVDGQRTIQLLKPLPVSSGNQQFEFRSTILGVYDKGKAGTVVKTEDVLVDGSTNETYARIVGSEFYIGQGGWNGPRGPKEPSFPPPHGRPSDKTITFQVTEGSAHLYRLNGDYNPLHGTPEPGKEMGYGGIILHGVYAYNRIIHDLLREFGGSDPANVKEFSARFSGVVRPGDQIQTDIWRTGAVDTDGWEDFRWTARVLNTGRVCLSDGRAVMTLASSKATENLGDA